ncbi:OpgC domain-containing protein [Bradyrhizobium sp. 2]|nr:OpgC domain-containing protein [Bradyrhizobium sp. 2]
MVRANRAPEQFLFEGLILRLKPVNTDVLPLYIVLVGVFPPILTSSGLHA